MDGPGMIYDA